MSHRALNPDQFGQLSSHLREEHGWSRADVEEAQEDQLPLISLMHSHKWEHDPESQTELAHQHGPSK